MHQPNSFQFRRISLSHVKDLLGHRDHLWNLPSHWCKQLVSRITEHKVAKTLMWLSLGHINSPRSSSKLRNHSENFSKTKKMSTAHHLKGFRRGSESPNRFSLSTTWYRLRKHPTVLLHDFLAHFTHTCTHRRLNRRARQVAIIQALCCKLLQVMDGFVNLSGDPLLHPEQCPWQEDHRELMRSWNDWSNKLRKTKTMNCPKRATLRTCLFIQNSRHANRTCKYKYL